MKKPNQDIRDLIKGSNIFNWQVAQHLGIGDNCFYTMLRKELSAEKREAIINAINEIKQEMTEVH